MMNGSGSLKRKLKGNEDDGESSMDIGTSCSEVERTDDTEDDGVKHVCPYESCKAEFRKVGKLNRHLLTHTGERPFMCMHPGCEKRFTRIQHLKRHEVVHTGERPFACTHAGCNHTFTVACHLTRHMITHETDKPYACTHEGCVESFAKHNQLKRHMCVHTSGLPYVCIHDGCGQSFNFPSLLQRHINRHHLGIAEKQFMCGETDCSMVFDRHSLLRAHVKESHPQVFAHKCTECGENYKRKKDLATHMGVHFPEQRKLFYCKEETCAKSFISASNLRTHIRAAHEQRRFVCTFSLSKSCLEETDQNDEICGKAFAYKHALERHMKTHTKPAKEKPPKKKTKTDTSIVAKIIGTVHYPPLPATTTSSSSFYTTNTSTTETTTSDTSTLFYNATANTSFTATTPSNSTTLLQHDDISIAPQTVQKTEVY